MKRIITVGDNCIDYYEEQQKGYPGGNPVNVAVYMKRMNQEVSYLGVVGTDAFGDLMIDSLKSKGVDLSHIKKEEGTTAMTMVSFNGNDRYLGDYYEGVLENFHLTSNDLEVINSYDLMVTGIWSKVEKNLADIHIPIAFDFADKAGSNLFNQYINEVDYAFYSDDKHNDEQLEIILKNLYGRKNQIIVVTRGKNGSLAYDGSRFYKQGIVECEVVDTLGAGDSFIAGFLVGMMNGQDIQECMKLGSKQASITIGYQGAW